MRTLEEFWKEAESGYERLRKDSVSAIKRWVYASLDLVRFDPKPFEAVGLSRGREVKSEAKARTKYGLDDQGRIVYEWGGVEGCFSEHFLIYEPGTIFRARYQCTLFKGKVIARFEGAQQLLLDSQGKAVALKAGIGPDAFQENYTWQDGKLIRAESAGLVTEFHYDSCGELKKVWRCYDNHRHLYFNRPPRKITLPLLERTLRAELPAEIRQAVRRCNIKEPVYCLALAYDGEGNGPLPPCLGIGLESERQKWSKERGKEAKYFIWNPAEFTHYEKPHTQLESGRLLRTMDLYSKLLESKSASDSRAIKLLNDVAKQLAGLDWSDSLHVTKDFVIYCVDFEMCDLMKNLRKTVPAGVLAQLKQKGYL